MVLKDKCLSVKAGARAALWQQSERVWDEQKKEWRHEFRSTYPEGNPQTHKTGTDGVLALIKELVEECSVVRICGAELLAEALDVITHIHIHGYAGVPQWWRDCTDPDLVAIRVRLVKSAEWRAEWQQTGKWKAEWDMSQVLPVGRIDQLYTRAYATFNEVSDRSLDSWVVKFLRLLKQHEFQEHWDGARSAAGPDVKREWRCGADYNFHGVHYVLEERATSDAVNAVVHVIHNHLKRLYVSLRTQWECMLGDVNRKGLAGFSAKLCRLGAKAATKNMTFEIPPGDGSDIQTVRTRLKEAWVQLKAAKARQKDPRVTTPDLLAAEANLKVQREALNTLEWERDKKLLDTEWEREAGMDPGVNYAVVGADKEDNTFKINTGSGSFGSSRPSPSCSVTHTT